LFTKSDSRRALVFVNGWVKDYLALSRFIMASDTIVCADGGLSHAIKLALPVDVLIGDMDSVQSDQLRMINENTTVFTYQSEKDETDMELALDWVQGQGFDCVVVIGIAGGRLDHTLANIHLLTDRRWRFDAFYWDEYQLSQILRGPSELHYVAHQGRTLSLIPLSAVVTGIGLKGMKYTMIDGRLAFASPQGVSNIIISESASVVIQTGVVAVMVSHQP